MTLVVPSRPTLNTAPPVYEEFRTSVVGAAVPDAVRSGDERRVKVLRVQACGVLVNELEHALRRDPEHVARERRAVEPAILGQHQPGVRAIGDQPRLWIVLRWWRGKPVDHREGAVRRDLVDRAAALRRIRIPTCTGRAEEAGIGGKRQLTDRPTPVGPIEAMDERQLTGSEPVDGATVVAPAFARGRPVECAVRAAYHATNGERERTPDGPEIGHHLVRDLRHQIGRTQAHRHRPHAHRADASSRTTRRLGVTAALTTTGRRNDRRDRLREAFHGATPSDCDADCPLRTSYSSATLMS